MKKNCAKDETALPTPASVNKEKKKYFLSQLVDIIYPIYCRLLFLQYHY